MQLHEFANRMSNILCGYGEALEEEMLARARELVDREKSVRAFELTKGETLRKHLGAIRELIEES